MSDPWLTEMRPTPPRAGSRVPGLTGVSAGLMWLAAGTVAVAVLLVPAYLAMRAAQGDATTWQLLLRPQTVAVLVRSAALAVGVTALSTLLAVPLAWITVRSDVPGRRTWRVLTALPLVIPSYVGAYLFVAALGPKGLVQQGLEPLGVQRLPDIYGFPGALLVLTLYTYPYSLIMAQAALQRMDPALEEASRTLGESAWGTFRRITLRQLQPALAAGGLLVALYTLRDFGAVSIMRLDTFTRVIYVQYRSAFDRASAASLSLLLIALALALVIAEMRSAPAPASSRTGPKSLRRPTRVALGQWRLPALGLCVGTVALSLVLPAIVLAYWLVAGLGDVGVMAGLLGEARNSVTASTIGAAMALLAALPVAWLSVRQPGRLSRTVERISYLGFALPGVVVALALVFFAAPFPILYQSMALLAGAYVVLFLPQAVGAVRASLLQVHPSLEESGRALGRRPSAVLRTITLPLVTPGIGAALALVFLTAMKELPATLILGPYDFGTLATGVWSAVSEAFFARAAAPALMLVLLSSVPMTLLVLRSESA